MCLTCGCCRVDDWKGDSRNLTLADLRTAANAAGVSMGVAAQNILATICKARVDAPDVALTVLKGSDEKRYTLGLAYGANLPDIGVAKDGFRDVVSPSVLEEAAWAYMRKGRAIGLHHEGEPTGDGTVVESYIWRAGDWPQPNGYVVKAGDWLLGCLWTPSTWDRIKKGEFTGFSPQGSAKRRKPSAETLASLRTR